MKGLVLVWMLVAAGLSAEPVKVAMVADGEVLLDHGYSQMVWEGLGRVSDQVGVRRDYRLSQDLTSDEQLRSFRSLIEDGAQVIVAPGFLFEKGVFQAQDLWPRVKFILLDGIPNSGTYDESYQERVASNTVSAFFAEEQAGFLAGLAAALERRTGEFACLGGIEIPPVQNYITGFRQGVVYANAVYGTSVSVNDKNVVYQGSFNNVDAGRKIAASLYDAGVSAIFVVAGGVGWGALQEAKGRTGVWIVGVDTDFYQDGIIPGTKRSVVLTSAVKRLDVVAQMLTTDALGGNFPGGQTFVFDATSGGVGIPPENPNLSPKTVQLVADVYGKLQSGELEVRKP